MSSCLPYTASNTLVLIETLWNVNQAYAFAPTPAQICINRNIVECKFSKAKASTALYQVLIETLWNVNFKKLNSDNGWSSINRNIVECKSFYHTHTDEKGKTY